MQKRELQLPTSPLRHIQINRNDQQDQLCSVILLRKILVRNLSKFHAVSPSGYLQSSMFSTGRCLQVYAYITTLTNNIRHTSKTLTAPETSESTALSQSHQLHQNPANLPSSVPVRPVKCLQVQHLRPRSRQQWHLQMRPRRIAHAVPTIPVEVHKYDISEYMDGLRVSTIFELHTSIVNLHEGHERHLTPHNSNKTPAPNTGNNHSP
jgi:hypothetical protein